MNGGKNQEKWEVFQDEWNNIHPCFYIKYSLLVQGDRK